MLTLSRMFGSPHLHGVVYHRRVESLNRSNIMVLNRSGRTLCITSDIISYTTYRGDYIIDIIILNRIVFVAVITSVVL